MSQSSAVASPIATDSPAARAGPRVADQLDPFVGQRGEDRRRVARGDPLVEQQSLRRVAGGGALHLGVDDDPRRHLQVGIAVDVDVAVARRRVQHRHRRDRLDRLLQPLAAARDQQVDDALLGRQLGQPVAVAGVEQQHRVLGQPRLGERLADDRGERRVGALGVARAAQDDRVAALDRQRGAVDGHVRARLVDHADDAERHADLPQVDAALQRAVVELLADRVLQRDHGAHARGHPGDPRRGQGQAVAQRVGEPDGALVGEVRGVRLEDRLGALVEQPRGRRQRRVLGGGRHGRERPRRALRRDGALGYRSGRYCHVRRVTGADPRTPTRHTRFAKLALKRHIWR